MTALTNFLDIHQDGLSLPILLNHKQTSNVSVYRYRFCSQYWPVSQIESIPTTQWCHVLQFFLPDKVVANKALLYVAGGYSNDEGGETFYKEPIEKLDYVSISVKSQSIVVELQNVPNQYLMMGGTPKKEDQFLAYTYKLFMETGDPYVIGRLPMVKSIIKAMDFTQELAEKAGVNIDGFVLSGMSKRGWAVWLAAIEDNRVVAVMPIIIDVLNTWKNLQHICSVYAEGCPYAFKDYIENGITKDVLNSDEFKQITDIEDPLQYLNYGEKYKIRFGQLSKYIINASGDDFFAVDSSSFYFPELPGKKHIRYLPNALHYMMGNPISDALGNMNKINEAIAVYFGSLVNNIPLPDLQYSFDENKIQVISSRIPDKAILWVAYNNESRDFRCLASYDWLHKVIKSAWSLVSSDLCDRPYRGYEVEIACDEEPCEMAAITPELFNGHQASFLETHYNVGIGDFIITTEIKLVAQSSHSAEC